MIVPSVKGVLGFPAKLTTLGLTDGYAHPTRGNGQGYPIVSYVIGGKGYLATCYVLKNIAPLTTFRAAFVVQ